MVKGETERVGCNFLAGEIDSRYFEGTGELYYTALIPITAADVGAFSFSRR